MFSFCSRHSMHVERRYSWLRSLSVACDLVTIDYIDRVNVPNGSNGDSYILQPSLCTF